MKFLKSLLVGLILWASLAIIWLFMIGVFDVDLFKYVSIVPWVVNYVILIALGIVYAKFFYRWTGGGKDNYPGLVLGLVFALVYFVLNIGYYYLFSALGGDVLA